MRLIISKLLVSVFALMLAMLTLAPATAIQRGMDFRRLVPAKLEWTTEEATY